MAPNRILFSTTYDRHFIFPSVAPRPNTVCRHNAQKRKTLEEIGWVGRGRVLEQMSETTDPTEWIHQFRSLLLSFFILWHTVKETCLQDRVILFSPSNM